MERGRIESLKRKLINPKSRVALNDVAEQISELAENCPQEIIILFLDAIKAANIGLGIPTIYEAFNQPVAPYDFLGKMIFTITSLGYALLIISGCGFCCGIYRRRKHTSCIHGHGHGVVWRGSRHLCCYYLRGELSVLWAFEHL